MSSQHYLYNTKTHQVVRIPDDIDGKTWISLSEERYGDKYKYPAIYNMDSHTVLDQSEALSRQGDWMMVAGSPSSSPHAGSGHSGSGTADPVTGVVYDSDSVSRLYSAAFRRAPDATGLKYWTDVVNNPQISFKSVADSFIQSDEFSSLVSPSSSDTEFATALYQNVLNRAPDAAGLEYWTVHMRIGLFSRADVLCGFAESAENIALAASLA